MGGYYYKTKAGDMWDYIAWLVYGNELQMDILLAAEENRELLDIYIFSAGVKVWCPPVGEKGKNENLPPWRNVG